MPLVGTHWFCRCGREYKSPVVSVGLVNELRTALQQSLEIIDDLADQQAMPDDWYVKEVKKLRDLLYYQHELPKTKRA